MNNTADDDPAYESTPEKQLICYNNNGVALWGIRFIYQADNAKLVYSRGRIFLIFAHYNDFNDDDPRHTADTVATFNDDLEDTDFGLVWGASHSLIQSATFDDNYFWSASLSDTYPKGIRVQYTSKTEFTNSWDSVNKKYNVRVNNYNDILAGTINGDPHGYAYGKLGGIMYYQKLGLYCLVYAKTPNSSDDEKNGRAIIYITTWKFENKNIEDIKIQEIKVFDEGKNIMQVKAGRLGNDKVFITYLGTDSPGDNYYGNIPIGSIPNYFVVKLPEFTILKNDLKNDQLLMNTNEDLRTFRNGVLIWAATDANNNLIINKIGTQKFEVETEENSHNNNDGDNTNNNDGDNTNNNDGDNSNNKVTDSGMFISFGIINLLVCLIIL